MKLNYFYMVSYILETYWLVENLSSRRTKPTNTFIIYLILTIAKRVLSLTSKYVNMDFIASLAVDKNVSLVILIALGSATIMCMLENLWKVIYIPGNIM